MVHKAQGEGFEWFRIHNWESSLSWARDGSHGIAFELSIARRDYFKQVINHGPTIENSKFGSFEVRHMDVYSQLYSDSIANAHRKVRKFLLSETTKQNAKTNILGSMAGSSSDGGSKQ